MEWTTVTVIIALVGFATAVIKPIVSLTKSITTLTVAVENLKEDLRFFSDKNTESHERIWNHEKHQDERLDDHEKRIIRIEEK